MENAAAISAEYGYALNDNFLAALQDAIVMAHKATVVSMIGLVAQNIFVTWKPPLEKIPPKFTPPLPRPGTIYFHGNH